MRALLVCALAVCPLRADTPAEFFEAKIRPLLATHCYACHTKSAMGGLRLDSAETLRKGGKSGPVIVAGKPAESLLIQAVRRTHERLKMPPTAALDPAQVTALETWVQQGAVWPQAAATPAAAAHRAFWSYQPLQPSPPPQVRDAARVHTPVDRFILARLEAQNLRPNPPADKVALLRRATLDVTGLPPQPAEVDAFLADTSPDAFRKVVERLLASPHYGERWGRHWLDLARYSDGLLAAGVDTPLPNAWRYRDWVVDAFNRDLPYDQFVKAQIAADLLPEAQRPSLLPGLGFQAIGAGANDQVDVTTKVFLGMTVGCAQCHDHKYDPIPARDYYSLLGVFRSSRIHSHPLVADAEVKAFEDQKKRVDAMKELIEDFLITQQKLLVDTLARHTARYMVAAWHTMAGRKPDTAGLDPETLERWVTYLQNRKDKEHTFLKAWYDVIDASPAEPQVRKASEEFQVFALQLLDEAKEVEDKNYVAFGGRKGLKDERTRQYTNIVALPVLKFYQWRELANGPYRTDGFEAPAGVYFYSTKQLDRWLGGMAKAHIEQLRAELKALEDKLPPQYPFLHGLAESDQPKDIPIALRGDEKTPGPIAPRAFLTALCDGDPKPFSTGSGRLELAEAIARHPLTARVIVNRIWQHHFGYGLVRTPSNFGQMGERPTHPELLDWLAARLIASRYSLKAIHREILLSSTYALSAAPHPANAAIDPDNRLLWRAPVRPRLDMEALRDSVLAVSGGLDPAIGGPAQPFTDSNRRRSLYLTVSRTRLDATMALFDFPDPNATIDDRPVTIGPLQGLFFLNSPFVREQARALVQRIEREAATPDARIRQAYRLLYGRTPDAAELSLGIEYTAGGVRSWEQYLQALLASGEFTSVP